MHMYGFGWADWCARACSASPRCQASLTTLRSVLHARQHRSVTSPSAVSFLVRHNGVPGRQSSAMAVKRVGMPMYRESLGASMRHRVRESGRQKVESQIRGLNAYPQVPSAWSNFESSMGRCFTMASRPFLDVAACSAPRHKHPLRALGRITPHLLICRKQTATTQR